MGIRRTALHAAATMLLACASLVLADRGESAEPAPGVLVLQAEVPLGDALEYLRSHGLRVVYSDMLVRPEFTVRSELRSGDPESLARQALAPWGLTLRRLDGGMVAVIAERTRWKLEGRVIARPEGTPVAGARIELQGGEFIAWTDAHGKFALRGAVGGTMRIRASASGYAAGERAFATYPGELPHVQIDLEPVELELGEVTVVASRFAVERQSPGVFVLEQDAFVAQPKNGEDALQATQRLPGMAFSGFSGRPNIRGGEASEMIVLLDGMPIREPFHLAGYNSAFSAIDEHLVARLTSYSGSLPTRYANRLAAAIDVESLDVEPATPNMIGLSSFNARLQLRGGPASRGQGEGFGWVMALRRGTLGALLERAVPDVGRPDTTDGFFKLVSTDSSGGEFGIQGLMGRSTYSYVDDETGEWAKVRGDARYLWLHARRRLEGVRLSALLGYSSIDSSRQGQLIGGLTPTGSLQDERLARLWNLHVVAEGEVGARHHVQAGLTLASGQGTYDYNGAVESAEAAARLFGLPDARVRTLGTKAERDLVGVHMEDRWKLRDGVFLEMGARMDRASTAGASSRIYFSPRASLRWSSSDAMTWRIGWSRANQLPEAHELRVEDGESTLPGAQHVNQTVVSLERRFRSGLVVRTEVYERRMPDPRVRFENILDQLRVLPDLAPDRIMLAPERSRSRGMEISAMWEKGNWTAWGAYNWSSARDRVDGEWVNRLWDQRHALHLSAAWHHGAWTVGGEMLFRGGRPATVFLDESLLAAELGPRGSARHPAHFSLDVRVARSFRLGDGQLNVYLQLINALDLNNRCCTEIDLPDESSDPLLFEVGPRPSYPLVPALGFRYEF